MRVTVPYPLPQLKPFVMIYDSDSPNPVPEDHIRTLAKTSTVDIPDKPSFGLDSWLGLAASCAAAPLYLYSSLKGKYAVWDEILNGIPAWCIQAPTLDVGSGRGMVLLKVAQRKKALAVDAAAAASPQSAGATHPVTCQAYGVDTFQKPLHRSYGPVDTYKNAAALSVLDFTVLHTADYTEKLPFADAAFALVTSNLVIHCAQKDGRVRAVREMARVCMPEGKLVIVDLSGHFSEHQTVLEALGWADIHVSLVGFRMSYGVIPCQLLTATKPASKA